MALQHRPGPRSCSRRFWLAGGVLFFCLARAAPAQVEVGWSQAALLQFNDAHATFHAAPSNRTQQVGLAATLLNVQPRTVANRERAKALLAALIREEISDQHTQAAHYLLGRVACTHESIPHLPTARMHFRAAMEGDAKSSFAQLAIAQLVLLSLSSGGPLNERIRTAEIDAADLSSGGIRAAVYWIMAQHLMDAQTSLPQALHFIEIALEEGLATSATRADALVAATRLSQELDGAVASNWRGIFLQEFPRDPRVLHLRAAMGKAR